MEKFKLSKNTGPLNGTLLIFSFAILISTYLPFLNLSVYGHDEVHYYYSFYFKFIEEGRWINYYAHKLLRSIPLPLFLIVYISTSIIFLYNIFRLMTSIPGYAVLASTAVVVSPPFVQQSLWPATTSPALLCLLLLQKMRQKNFNHRLIYCLGGITLFGAMQNFYFLLPLIFLDSFQPARNNALKAAINHIVWWVIGSFLGAAFMLSIVYLRSGQIGLKIADWRQTNPIRDIGSFIDNATFSIASLFQNFLDLTLYNDGKLYIIIFMLTITMLNFYRSRNIYCLYSVVSAVYASYFVFNIVLGAPIYTRSLEAAAAAIVILLFSFFDKKKIAFIISVCAISSLMFNFHLKGREYLTAHRDETSFFYNKIYGLIPFPPRNIHAIALQGTMTPDAASAAFFNNAPRMHAIALALGSDDFWDCRQAHPSCSKITTREFLSTTSLEKGELSLYKTNLDKVLYLEFSQSE
ncbi:hypothetical protein [Ochrobactrum sp. S1502_03]|uniref:hypothetical protein n=1 Tax=Ochrobactrum sp. S1502_03 TaxID=3108451 RepID=UPI0037CA60BC